MKKKYQKPIIVIEDFTATDEYALGCGAIMNMNDVTTCQTDKEFVNGIFREGMMVEKIHCSVPLTEDEMASMGDGLCYHTSAGNAIFGS